MRHKFIIRPEAEADIENSFNWYEDQQEGLGHDFKNSVSHSFDRIKSNPLSFPEV